MILTEHESTVVRELARQLEPPEDERDLYRRWRCGWGAGGGSRRGCSCTSA